MEMMNSPYYLIYLKKPCCVNNLTKGLVVGAGPHVGEATRLGGVCSFNLSFQIHHVYMKGGVTISRDYMNRHVKPQFQVIRP